jgi:hypothetical protein
VGQPSLLADFGSTVLLGAIWIVLLILSHASPGAIEVVLTFCVAYLIETLASQSGASGTLKKSDKVTCFKLI